MTYSSLRREPTDEQLEEIAEDLRATAEAVLQLRDPTEADLRHRLFLVLGRFALDTLGLSQEDVKQEGTSVSGRYDSLFGRAVIEYKQPRLLDSHAERHRAAAQALRYLESDTLGAHVVIITDGQTWGVLRDPDAGPEPGEQAWLDLGLDDALLPPERRFVWRENSNPSMSSHTYSDCDRPIGTCHSSFCDRSAWSVALNCQKNDKRAQPISSYTASRFANRCALSPVDHGGWGGLRHSLSPSRLAEKQVNAPRPNERPPTQIDLP